MINFPRIPRSSLVGSGLRRLLGFLPENLQVPILQGPLRGWRWIVGSSNHGCWLGTYEPHVQRLLVTRVKPGDTVFDLGAHVGFFTLLAAKLVGESGRVVAFEPLPENLDYLYKHLRLNRLDSVTVVEAAVTDHLGQVSWQPGPNRSTGRLTEQDSGLQVEAVSLDDLWRKGRLPAPDWLKIDVEGAELAVLLGAQGLLGEHLPGILLATHGDDARQECTELLVEIGYVLEPIGQGSIDTAPEILAISAARRPPKETAHDTWSQ